MASLSLRGLQHATQQPEWPSLGPEVQMGQPVSPSMAGWMQSAPQSGEDFDPMNPETSLFGLQLAVRQREMENAATGMPPYSRV